VSRRIAITGGGTAGHVMAGLAFLKAYREEGAECFFIGAAGGEEGRLVPASGERLTIVKGSPYERQRLRGRMAAVINVARGTIEARRELKRLRPDLIIGVGGYASMGPSLAARSLGIPLVIHEANAVPGRANRALARFSARVCGGFEETASGFPGVPVEWVGNPVDCGISRRAAPPGERLRCLVAGGSEGSPFLNREAPGLFVALCERGVEVSVRHLAGNRDIGAIREAYAKAGIAACVSGFVDGMAAVYAEADFALACPGAMTLAEIAAQGLPCLLVPLSTAAEQHQDANARAFAGHTGTRWTTEQAWDARRDAAWIAQIAGDPRAWSAVSARVQSWARPGAARAVVRVCEEVLAGRNRRSAE
jgi:UDP-N-acetylglucosamine--N-acetylmuramyl-(pentapeptide) pyrophosphoryl-undecaprenol N-acetylglucosamine transferase